MTGVGIVFDPLLPWEVVAVLGALALLSILPAALRGGGGDRGGWWFRLAGLGILILALCGPHLRREERRPLPATAFLVVDASASTELEDRAAQVAAAHENLLRELAEAGGSQSGGPEGGFDVEVVTVPGETEGSNDGTQLLTALADAAERVSPEQIAGAILLTDGRIHDTDRLTDFPAPVHALVAGEQEGFDLRLELVSAPAFGIVDEDVVFRLKLHALGKRPADLGVVFDAEVSVDGGAPVPLRLHTGTVADATVRIGHGGPNIVDIRLPGRADELTKRNNRIISEVNGVRDRLRVLLVSGEPHPGGRTWRDILKSDPAVDLIHFTILRPPGKQDSTPTSELSLISFPTQELFSEKIDEFDLIVFDRYRWRGLLNSDLLRNVADYVREGGAILVSTGAAFAGKQSLSRTPLIEVLPAQPQRDVIERPYLPRVTELGTRHPVTVELDAMAAGSDGDRTPTWGRWLRQISVNQNGGHAVMEGADGKPLLILDRVRDGRVALLTTDQAWLWTRGFEGGGPQAELVRRTAHWLMREPALEEETLSARFETGQGEERLVIERRSLAATINPLVRALPPGDEEAQGAAAWRDLNLRKITPGRWQAVLDAPEEGLWRIRHETSGETLETIAALGPPSPREYENPLATDRVLEPLVTASGGKTAWLADGTPDIRLVREGRRAFSRHWIGLERREAHEVTGARLHPLLPAWVAALVTALFFLAAWRLEGRQTG